MSSAQIDHIVIRVRGKMFLVAMSARKAQVAGNASSHQVSSSAGAIADHVVTMMKTNARPACSSGPGGVLILVCNVCFGDLRRGWCF